VSISAIIFSKDRACQLELLLRSIDKNCPDLFDEIVILWNFSNQHYIAGYQKLQEIYDLSDKHSFLCEDNQDTCLDNFGDETVRLIKGSRDHVCLLTDDTVFYRPFEFKGKFVDQFLQEEKSVFSLRLGYNTVIQNIHAQPKTYQPYLHFRLEEDGLLSWKPRDYNCLNNYGYPFSIDGHIYNTEFLSSLVSQFTFNNTNQLESRLFDYRHYVNKMYSFIESCCVNVPINNMSNFTVAGKFFPLSTKELNTAFLNGKKIRLEDVEKVKIKGCHQEINYSLE
jgi:hypothetical protein